MKVAAVVTAAGAGVRMGSRIPKQYLAFERRAYPGSNLDGL